MVTPMSTRSRADQAAVDSIGLVELATPFARAVPILALRRRVGLFSIAANSEVIVMHTSAYLRSIVALGLLLGVTSARANAQGPFLTVCRDGTVWSLNRAGICGGHGGL